MDKIKVEQNFLDMMRKLEIELTYDEPTKKVHASLFLRMAHGLMELSHDSVEIK